MSRYKLNPHKACGPDGLSARIIRECAEELSVPIELLCRLSVRSGVFPCEWKRANVISVFKKGSKKASRKLPTSFSLGHLFKSVGEGGV